MLRRLIGEDVQISMRLEPDLRLVEADPSQVEQVILKGTRHRSREPRIAVYSVRTFSISASSISSTMDSRSRVIPQPGKWLFSFRTSEI
jgi:hypothetical protein